MSSTPLDAYDEGVHAKRWKDDPLQRTVLEEFERIHYALLASEPDGLFERMFKRFSKPSLIRGAYVHGGVGRGKTFLMDLFFQSLPFESKLRLHFHHFMQQVHGELATIKNEADPLAIVAERLSKRARVLCFDEFVVIDIGDAMILGRLLKYLFEHGVTLVATSNCAPSALYQDGLQRAQFLPAIALLEQHCKTLHLDSPTDYRLRALKAARTYYHPHGEDTEVVFEALFKKLATSAIACDQSLEVNGRTIPARMHSDAVAWFDFAALCKGPRAAADYIELAREFNTILLSDVPILDESLENETRRFVHLVDEFYDRKVNLIISAAVSSMELYAGNKVKFEFQRTLSRLTEMQSEEYLASAHRA